MSTARQLKIVGGDEMKEKLASLAKSRYFIPTIMMIFSLSLVAYAVTTVSVHNTVTITSGANIQIIYQPASFGTNCPTSGYSTSPSAVPLTEPAGGSATAFLCINNIGTGSDTPTVSIDPTSNPSCGANSCFLLQTSPLSAIPANSFSSPITVTISNSYSTAQASAIDLIVNVT